MTYKFRINSYITSYQKQLIDNQILNNAKLAAAEQAQQNPQVAAVNINGNGNLPQ